VNGNFSIKIVLVQRLTRLARHFSPSLLIVQSMAKHDRPLQSLESHLIVMRITLENTLQDCPQGRGQATTAKTS